MGYRFDPVNHVHSLNGYPLTGTTRALEVIAKPLTWWAAGLTCAEFGWLNPRDHSKEDCAAAASVAQAEIAKLNPDEYLRLLGRAYRAHNASKDKAARKGVKLHEMAEAYIKAKIAKETIGMIDPQLVPFAVWCDANVKEFLFSEVHVYSERLWTGGILDFGYLDKDWQFALSDVKSSPAAYFTQFVQIGGYDIQLSEHGGFSSEGDKLFEPMSAKYHAVFPFGKGFTVPTISMNVEAHKRSFEFARWLYKEKKNFEESYGNAAGDINVLGGDHVQQGAKAPAA